MSLCVAGSSKSSIVWKPSQMFCCFGFHTLVVSRFSITSEFTCAITLSKPTAAVLYQTFTQRNIALGFVVNFPLSSFSSLIAINLEVSVVSYPEWEILVDAYEPLHALPLGICLGSRHVTVVLSPLGMKPSAWLEWWVHLEKSNEFIDIGCAIECDDEPAFSPPSGFISEFQTQMGSVKNCPYSPRPALRHAKILRSCSMPSVYKYAMVCTEFPFRQINPDWGKAYMGVASLGVSWIIHVCQWSVETAQRQYDSLYL